MSIITYSLLGFLAFIILFGIFFIVKQQSAQGGTAKQGRTYFYPQEGGGQVGDKGYLEAPNGNVTYIYDTKT